MFVTRLASFALAALLVAGCELLPLPEPPPLAIPSPHCDAVVTHRDGLRCHVAVDAALDALGPDHPPIDAIRFRYGPCDCPPGTVCDCAIHLFGTVTMSFRGNEQSGTSFHVKPTPQGTWVAIRNPEPVP
jgi:hypothetical protein